MPRRAPADSRTQTIIDTQDVMVPAALWRSLAVRHPSGVTLTNSAFTTNITLAEDLASTEIDDQGVDTKRLHTRRGRAGVRMRPRSSGRRYPPMEATILTKWGGAG